jgi:hypothetical protein
MLEYLTRCYQSQLDGTPARSLIPIADGHPNSLNGFDRLP